MAKHLGLGKGLDSLIPEKTGNETKKDIKIPETKAKAEEPEKNSEIKVKLSLVSPNRQQPRKNFDEAALNELAESIKIHGIIQPLIVVKKEKGYEIIAGERRFRAARIAGLKEVPVIIKDYTEKEIDEIALIENIQRENLNAIEEAQAYEKLIKVYGLKQEELANRISKSRSSVTNLLRLLKLSPQVQSYVVEGKLSEGHARTLISLNNKEQERIAKIIIEKGLSVREAEALTKKKEQGETKKPAKKEADEAEYVKLENNLKRYIGSKVQIKREGAEKGKIDISYFSLEELERISEIIRKGSEAE